MEVLFRVKTIYGEVLPVHEVMEYHYQETLTGNRAIRAIRARPGFDVYLNAYTVDSKNLRTPVSVRLTRENAIQFLTNTVGTSDIQVSVVRKDSKIIFLGRR